MPSWLVGSWPHLGIVAAKAALIYGVAVLGLRVAHRRTLAQWSAIDFAAAVAIGALVGRTAVAGDQSFIMGAVALLTVLAAHTAVTFVRFGRLGAKLVDHRVRVLVAHGRVRWRQMVICGVTRTDLESRLRQLGVDEIGELRYVLYEGKGELTVVPEDGSDDDAELVAAGLRDAAEAGPD